ncbi:MAG TPA: hypothetical protein V6D47_00565 [Oscillatoriaceae cyanobacterium]
MSDDDLLERKSGKRFDPQEWQALRALYVQPKQPPQAPAAPGAIAGPPAVDAPKARPAAAAPQDDGWPKGEISWGELNFNKLSSLENVGGSLEQLGVVASLKNVAAAYTQTTYAPGAISQALNHFATHLSSVAKQLDKLPGVGLSLQALGGVAGIVSGVKGLSETVASVKADGHNLQNSLHAASSAAKLVGGVAMALSSFCPPLAPLGGAISLAGAALGLGKVALEHRGELKQAGAKVADGAKQALDGVSRIISNNGSAAVKVDLAAKRFAWMTG